MRNILTSVAVLLLLVALLVGCDDKHTMHKLVQLEARLDHAPDSVLDVLATTTPPRRGERQALHALLTVLAQEKTGTTVTDDSLPFSTTPIAVLLHTACKLSTAKDGYTPIPAFTTRP